MVSIPLQAGHREDSHAWVRGMVRTYVGSLWKRFHSTISIEDSMGAWNGNRKVYFPFHTVGCGIPGECCISFNLYRKFLPVFDNHVVAGLLASVFSVDSMIRLDLQTRMIVVTLKVQ